MRAVISLGGSVIADAVADNTLDDYVEVLEEVAAETETLVIVTGAGALKQYIDALTPFGVQEAWKDLVGIQATKLHATTLAAALDANVAIPDSLEAVAELSRTHDIVVLGGLLSGQSTDAVAAECAEIIDADRLVLATTVDGVYDTDPREHDDADKYHQLSYRDLLHLITEHETTAGSYALIDILAAKLIQRSQIPTVVLDGRDTAELSLAVTDDHHGTLIAAGDDD